MVSLEKMTGAEQKMKEVYFALVFLTKKGLPLSKSGWFLVFLSFFLSLFLESFFLTMERERRPLADEETVGFFS